MPLGFGGSVKAEDSDLKLDFNFEPVDVQASHHDNDKPMTRQHPGATSIPATADDLNLKIASVKKVWETESNSGPEGSGPVPQPGFGSQGFVVADEKPFGVSNSEVGGLGEDPNSSGGHNSVSPYDKSDLTGTNVAKVRPQLQQPQQQQQQQQQTQQQQQQQHLINAHLQQQHHQQQIDAGRNAAYNRLMGSGGLPTLHSPPSLLSQPPSLYQAFQMDPSRGMTNPIYPTYHGMGAQSVVGLSGNAADLFGPPPPTNNQFRMQANNSAQYGGHNPGGQSTANQVLLSQSLMSSGGMKPTNQIGPIGTKAGTAAAYQQVRVFVLF